MSPSNVSDSEYIIIVYVVTSDAAAKSEEALSGRQESIPKPDETLFYYT